MTEEEKKTNLRWFKFYFVYRDAFKELSSRRCKKLILAICDYVQYGFENKKLDKKTKENFDMFKSFYDFDKQMAKINGSKGGRRAKKGGYRQPRGRDN